MCPGYELEDLRQGNDDHCAGGLGIRGVSGSVDSSDGSASVRVTGSRAAIFTDSLTTKRIAWIGEGYLCLEAFSIPTAVISNKAFSLDKSAFGLTILNICVLDERRHPDSDRNKLSKRPGIGY